MAIEFQGSPAPTIGVEVEVQLIERTTQNLAPAAVSVLDEAMRIGGLRLKAELSQAMVEINTEICRSVSDVRESLLRQFEGLRQIADRQGLDLAVSGTHPFQDWRERRIFPDERHWRILEKYQWLARRWTTFGLHVHVGIKDGERAIAIQNALISYIPHLLALSASSPFWGGTDTGLVSCRAAVTESFPTGGLPPYLPNWTEFEKYFETLLATGAIGSIKDLYWDIRPHFDFGTIELRVCDGISNLKDTLAIVALVQSLIVWIDRQLESGGRSPAIRMQRYWLAPENKWQAIRYGLEGQIVTRDGEERRPLREEIEKLLGILMPVASSLGCVAELSNVRDILKRGSGSAFQRQVFAGTNSLKEVVHALVRALKEATTLSSCR